jgi:hypothetical protein
VSMRATEAGEISKKINVFLVQYIPMPFLVLVSLRFDLIRESFCEQTMESLVIRYIHMTLHRENGKSRGS